MDRNVLRETIVAIILTAAGTALAVLSVYVGTGMYDGFDDRGLRRMGQRMYGYLPYAIVAWVLVGPLLRGYYALVMKTSPPAWLMLISVARAFVHFPLIGAAILFSIVFGVLLGVLKKLAVRVRRAFGAAAGSGAVAVRDEPKWTAIPVWILAFPFQQSDGPELSPAYLRRRLVWLLPVLMLLIGLFTDAVAEDTGTRIDPCWLTLAASYWLSDFLIVCFQVVPILYLQELGSRHRF